MAGIGNEVIDVLLRRGKEGVGFARLHSLVGYEIAIDTEENGEVHLGHVAARLGKEQHVLRSCDLLLVAPANGEGGLSHRLEDAGPERGVDAQFMEVEVELPL